MSEDFARELGKAAAEFLNSRPRVLYSPLHPLEAYSPVQLECAVWVASRLGCRGLVLLAGPEHA